MIAPSHSRTRLPHGSSAQATAFFASERLSAPELKACVRKSAHRRKKSLLKKALRDSGELALREFVGHWRPTESASALVIYEDARVAVLFLHSDFSVTLMTTLAFAETVAEWGVNADAVAALKAISPQFNLKPAVVGDL